MSKKLKGLDLHKSYTGRDAIITHNDLDGIMCGAIAMKSLENIQKDAIIMYDIDPSAASTDAMIEECLVSLNNLSMNMFERVIIMDRSSCSIVMAKKLKDLGVKEIIHIDHHVKNRQLSEAVASEIDIFKSVYEEGTKYVFSAAHLTFKHFTLDLVYLDKTFALLFVYTIMTDLYDTFKWTKIENEPNLIYDLYGFTEREIGEIAGCLPIDSSSVMFNYLFRFLEPETFFEILNESLDSGADMLGTQRGIVRKYRDLENRTLDYINYSYNDAVNKVEDSKYKSELFTMLAKNSNGDVVTADVLFVDRPLDNSVSSVASYRFLKDNLNVILVYRSSNPSSLFSCRTCGDLSSLSLSTLFNGGGGHFNASGFKIEHIHEELEELKNKNVEDIKEALRDAASRSVSVIEI